MTIGPPVKCHGSGACKYHTQDDEYEEEAIKCLTWLRYTEHKTNYREWHRKNGMTEFY